VLLLILLTGCASQKDDTQHSRVVNAYARLSLLHEREKLALKLPDSLYQIKVRMLFDSLKMGQDEFRHAVDLQTRDDAGWKSFMADVQHEMQRIKTQREKQH
jgi:hypothetical protein